VPNPTATPTATPSPTPTATATPVGTSKYAKPAFHLTIPKRMKIVRGRAPQFISSGTLSISIQLTADTFGIPPNSIHGNPAITNVNGATGIPCSNGCTVYGPPSPIGTDTFTITTYDAAGGTGKALDTLVAAQFVIKEGTTNSPSATLLGIPASITIGSLPAATADSTPSISIGAPTTATIPVTALDADGETITGTYANAVTLSDPDTNGDGTSLQSSVCPAYPAGNPSTSPTSVSLTADDQAYSFCYGGVAENPVTLTASATGATSATAKFQPTLLAPVYYPNSASGAVATTNPPNIELTAATGNGSTATISFSEGGWTDAPYNQQLSSDSTDRICTQGGPFSSYATITNVPDPSNVATQYTVTAISSPTPGDCGVFIGDGLTSNGTDAFITMDISYTTSSIIVNGKPRRKR
jgi:hypothetical protein